MRKVTVPRMLINLIIDRKHKQQILGVRIRQQQMSNDLKNDKSNHAHNDDRDHDNDIKDDDEVDEDHEKEDEDDDEDDDDHDEDDDDDDDDDEFNIDDYDLQSAIRCIFSIIRLGNEVCPFHEQLAIDLLERFPAAAQMILPGRGDLFLHLACGRDSPESIIRALLKAWPDAVSMRTRHWPSHDENHKFLRIPKLPLHLACLLLQSLKTIQLLVEAWPTSIREYYQRDNDFLLLPLHHHIGNKTVSLEMAQYLVEQWPKSIKVQIHGNRVTLPWACERCSPPAIIQYLAEQWPEAIQKRQKEKICPCILHVLQKEHPWKPSLILFKCGQNRYKCAQLQILAIR